MDVHMLFGKFLNGDALQGQPQRRARCRRCRNLNFDHLSGRTEQGPPWFCGWHGRARVDPDGRQPNLDGRGGCSFDEANWQTELF